MYPFTYASGSWNEQATISPATSSAGAFFGEHVATDGELIIAGSDPYGGAAYLFDVVPCACPADLDGDGVVSVVDFLSLLAQWGTDPGGPPDFDGNGDVGVADMLWLLADWGPCP